MVRGGPRALRVSRRSAATAWAEGSGRAPSIHPPRPQLNGRPSLRLRRQFRDAISLSARHGPLRWAASPARAELVMIELQPLQRHDGCGGIDLAGLQLLYCL